MISIIIPVLNEANQLGRTLERTLALTGDKEIIVVDGGSTDGTEAVARSFPGVRWMRAGRSRATQMNAGAARARGTVLLFLHADTHLPADGLPAIERAMRDPRCVGGSFRLRFDRSYFFLDLYSWLSRVNHSLFTYGDNAIFVRTSTFTALGGYRPIPLLEDVEIQTRLRGMGPFVKLPQGVTTSARRFQKTGVTRQVILNVALAFLYRLGMSPARMKKWYPDH